MEERIVYRVLYKTEPVYEIYADGSVVYLRTGERWEYPSDERLEEMTRVIRTDKHEIGDLRSDRHYENPPFNNPLERRVLRPNDMFIGQVAPSGVAYVPPSEEDEYAFASLEALGCAPKDAAVTHRIILGDGVDYHEPYYDEIEQKYDEDRANIEVQYFGKADKPWDVRDYDEMRNRGVVF